MRLDELTPYKTSPAFKDFVDAMAPMQSKIGVTGRLMVLKQFETFLEQQGFKPISHGVFGAVFTHPGIDYVIKVFKNDPAYLSFFRYVLAHQSNPCLPRLRGKFMKLADDHFVIRMEKLLPLDSSADEMVLQLLEYAASRDWTDAKAFYSRGFAAINNGNIQGNKKALLAALSKLYKETTLLPTIIALQKMRGSFEMDVKENNFMKRADGTMVIIDPYVNKAAVDV